MMFSNSVKMPVVAVAMLMSCGAFAQEQAGKPVATIESDDRETLELFLDWASIRAGVRKSFQEQGMRMPDGLEDWLAAIRGRITIEEHMIAVWPEGSDRREARNFIDELFHVFRNSVFRQHYIERLRQQMMAIQEEISENRSALREGTGEWREPEQIAQEYLEVRESLYELDLNSAQTSARLGALQKQIEQRIEELKVLADTQVAAVQLKITALQKALESRRAEIEGKERLFEKEFITEEELRAPEQRLLEQESALADQMALLEALRLGQGDDMLRGMKNLLIQSESKLAIRLATRQIVEGRLAELKQTLHLAGEKTHRRTEANELASHQGKLLETKRQLERGGTVPLIPVEGLPQLRLRWVN